MLNPANTKEAWVGAWDYGSTHNFGGQIGGTGGWKSLNVTPITLNPGGPIWTGMDGYLDQATGNHVIVVVCGLVVGANLEPGRQRVGTSFPNGVGGIVFNPSGQPYVVALPGALPKGSPQSSTKLLTLPAGSSTWTDAGGDSIGSYASWPTCITMTTKGMVLLASDEDFSVYGFPLA